MATNGSNNGVGQSYRTCYAVLLRLYPRPFRERFGEGMAQAFHDLCRERAVAGGALFPLALWIFAETLLEVLKENLTQMPLGKTISRVALGALAVWMVPVVAAQFVDDWHWGVGGFARVYCVLFLTGMAIALIARRMGIWSYKAGVAVALAAGLGLGWSTMVQVADSEHPERLWFHSVLVVGLVGASLSRLRASGLATTLFAMAALLVLISLALPSRAPSDQALRMAIGHAVFAVLFASSGFLFRHASMMSRHSK